MLIDASSEKIVRDAYERAIGFTVVPPAMTTAQASQLLGEAISALCRAGHLDKEFVIKGLEGER